MVTRRSPSDSADVSDIEALREALAKREAEVEEMRLQIARQASAGQEFLSAAAHAIRNPLAVTHSYLEILVSDLRNGLTEEQQSFLGIAYENAIKLRQLVDDLVDLAALETGTAQIDLKTVFVHEVITSLQSEWRSVAEQKRLKLETEISDDLPAVEFDEGRLKDVLRRLIENAFRFTPGGGSVSVRAHRERDRVAIEVVDNGIGIPAARITDSFLPFVQLHRRPGENRTGFGLGLPLCRRMVEAFGGTIELTSIEGEGTTVSVEIPASRPK